MENVKDPEGGRSRVPARTCGPGREVPGAPFSGPADNAAALTRAGDSLNLGFKGLEWGPACRRPRTPVTLAWPVA